MTYSNRSIAYSIAIEAARRITAWEFEDFCIEVRDAVAAEVDRLFRDPDLCTEIMAEVEDLDYQELYTYRPEGSPEE